MEEITTEAKVENIETVTAFVDSFLEAHDCPLEVQMQVDVALDELFGNIALYAYGESTGNATLQLDFDEANRMMRLTLIDQGTPYNPLEKEDPDITLSAEERDIGGLGIFIVKNTMDDVSYVYEDGSNKLTIFKKI